MKRQAPWSAARVDQFLAEVRVPVRLACNGSAGHPLLASLWYLPHDGKLWCATQSSARVTELLMRDPRCAFEVSVEAPPYRGVRGRGLAKIHEDRGEAVLRALIDRYLGGADSRIARTLLARVESEVAIEIDAQALVTWDYRDRMRGAA